MTEEGAMEVWRLAHDSSGSMTLHEAACELGYESSRGIAKRISAAWKWLNYNGESIKATEIARTFVNRNNKFPWKGKWA